MLLAMADDALSESPIISLLSAGIKSSEGPLSAAGAVPVNHP